MHDDLRRTMDDATLLLTIERLRSLYNPIPLLRSLLRTWTRGCQHDFAWVRAYLAQEDPVVDAGEVIHLLQQLGASCDCTVLRRLVPEMAIYLLGDPRPVCYALKTALAQLMDRDDTGWTMMDVTSDGVPIWTAHGDADPLDFTQTRIHLASALSTQEVEEIIVFLQECGVAGDYKVAELCDLTLYRLKPKLPPLEVAARCFAVVQGFIEHELQQPPDDYELRYLGLTLTEPVGCHGVVANHQEDLRAQEEAARFGTFIRIRGSRKSLQFFLTEEPPPLHVQVCGHMQ